MSSKPVSSMCVVKDSLLVAHGECISVISLHSKGNERRMARLGGHQSKHLQAEEVTVLSVAAAPERGLVFGGYSDGSVAIWSSKESEAYIVLRAHQSETTQLEWLDGPPWGPALLTGGGDGKVTTWSLAGSQEDYVFWTPQGVAAAEEP